jgi:hypothetical protein
MKRANIYLDTLLWNVLCDQPVNPEELVASLASKNATLVLSAHNIYELAKTFRSNRENSLERGTALFSYMKKFVDVNTPCAKDPMDLLEVEIGALYSQTSTIEAFLCADDYDSLIRLNVDKLAGGDFDEQAGKSIEARTAFPPTARSGLLRHLKSRPDIKQKLKAVPPGALGQWLQEETTGPAGVANLTDHIRRRFYDVPETVAEDSARALLASPAYRVARGLVRADLYNNWRCAHRDSNPPDLVDDMYHVLSSAYCEIYATKEKKQAEYARLLLSASTQVAIYDGRTPMDLWLEHLA